MQRTFQNRTVWTIILVGLALRLLIVVYYAPRNAWSGDNLFYLRCGEALASTGKYSQTPNRDFMPGMAALVAVGCQIDPLGCKYFPVLLFAFCGTAAAAGLWWLLLPTLRPTARIPALVSLQFGVMELIVFVFRLLPDLPALTLGIGAICALVASQRSRPLLYRFLAGVLLGAALYLRPDYTLVLLTVPLVWSVTLYRHLGIWRVSVAYGTVLLSALLVVLPWGIRNKRLTGEFRVFSDLGKRVLWWGFNENRNLDWNQGVEYDPSQVKTFWEQDDGLALKEAGLWAWSHPLESAFLMTSRVASHISPMPPTLISAAANPMTPRWLRWAYRGTAILAHECWIMIGLIALLTMSKRLPLPLVLLGVFVACRIAFPGSVLPDGGRYALVLVPFLSCCAIWFVGGFERVSVRPSWFAIVTGVLVIQVWFVSRWGLWR